MIKKPREDLKKDKLWALAAGRSGNKLRWPWRGHPAVKPVSASCATGKITNTSWQKGRKLTVQLGMFPVPFLCRHSFTTLKSDPVCLADLTQPDLSSFFPIPSLPLHCLSVYSSHYKDGSLNASSFGACSLPSFILRSLMFASLYVVCDGRTSITVIWSRDPHSYFTVGISIAQFLVRKRTWEQMQCWVVLGLIFDGFGFFFHFLSFSFCSVAACSVCCTIFPVGFFQC